MKNNTRYAAVITLLVLHLYNLVRSLEFFKYFFKNLGFGFRYINLLDTIQNIFYILTFITDFVLIALFFSSTGRYQDKVYKLLRYIFLITFFLYLPYMIYTYASGNSFFYEIELSQQVLHGVNLLLNLTCMVFFLRAKPVSQPAAIDLAEYELVSYTFTGHRFIHYLLDMLFVLPIFLFWRQVLPYHFQANPYLMQLLLVITYLAYCFLSESIFRQTLGKIATGSCVTTIGRPFTPGRILLRTLARLIPFDKLSFLFRANWHDKTTYTSVVYIDTWEKVFDESNPTENLATKK